MYNRGPPTGGGGGRKGYLRLLSGLAVVADVTSACALKRLVPQRQQNTASASCGPWPQRAQTTSSLRPAASPPEELAADSPEEAALPSALASAPSSKGTTMAPVRMEALTSALPVTVCGTTSPKPTVVSVVVTKYKLAK